MTHVRLSNCTYCKYCVDRNTANIMYSGLYNRMQQNMSRYMYGYSVS
jgi:uncharacterized Fe-S cluster-containing MiaB family protein